MDIKKVKIQVWLLALIISFGFLTRIYRLHIPDKYYFDEVYHAVTAKAYANNIPDGYEWWHKAPEPDTAYEWLHPPVGKLLMALGLKVFGFSAFGWRMPGIFFGVGVIWLTYLLAMLISKNQQVGLLAAFLASLDGLLLAQSRIGMNDIYVTFFILLSLIFYKKFYDLSTKPLSSLAYYYLLMTGLATGLAISTKWSGIFLLIVYGIMEGLRGIIKIKRFIFRLPLFFSAMVCLPLLIYVLSFGQFWMQGHTIAQFKELHNQIWWYQTHLKATHPYQSKPIQWFLNLKPVWYFVDYGKERTAYIYNWPNPAIIFWGNLSLLYLLWLIIKSKKKWYKSNWWFLLASYLAVWMPWFLSPRIMFSYHYTPAMPLLIISLAMMIKRFWESQKLRLVAVAMMVSIIFSFAFFYPIWVGIPIKNSWVKYFYWLPTWK